MRTNIIYIIVFILIAHIADAQSYGFKAGVNFANVSTIMNGVTASPKSLTGFHGGVLADFNLKENLYFNSGILFSMKGFSGEGDVGQGNTSLTATLYYLELPLNLTYKIPIKDKSRFFIQAGPYIGYGIGVTEKVGNESEDGSFKEAGLKSLDSGLGFGGGVEFGTVAVGINYQIGLSDINDAHDVLDAVMKNKVLQISLIIMSHKKK